MCQIKMSHKPVIADMDADYAKQIRNENGLTQKELAELLGVDQSLVSKIENGKSTVSETVKRAYIEKLNAFDTREGTGIALPFAMYADMYEEIEYLTSRCKQLVASNAYLKEQNARLRAQIDNAEEAKITGGDWWPRSEKDLLEEIAAEQAKHDCNCGGECEWCECKYFDYDRGEWRDKFAFEDDEDDVPF